MLYLMALLLELFVVSNMKYLNYYLLSLISALQLAEDYQSKKPLIFTKVYLHDS